MAVGILDTHLIHAPPAQRRRLKDPCPLPCPLLVQLVNLVCRVGVEMKPSTRRPLALLRQNELNLSASNESKSRSTRLPRRQEPLLLIRPSEPEPEAENIDVICYAAHDAIDTKDGPTTKQTAAVAGTHCLKPLPTTPPRNARGPGRALFVSRRPAHVTPLPRAPRRKKWCQFIFPKVSPCVVGRAAAAPAVGPGSLPWFPPKPRHQTGGRLSPIAAPVRAKRPESQPLRQTRASGCCPG